MKIGITNKEQLKIRDDNSEHIYYGHDQEWYTSDWQRRSGCGPSVACNLFAYLNKGDAPLENKNPATSGAEEFSVQMKSQCLPFMEEVWTYVTPTDQGIPSTTLFTERVMTYAQEKNLPIHCVCLDIPQEKPLRPTLDELLDYLKEALYQDIPIAFLNLCNGEEKDLEPWHWVTIISVEYAEGQPGLQAEILDEGKEKHIDLALWLETTDQGGGFVCCMPR